MAESPEAHWSAIHRGLVFQYAEALQAMHESPFAIPDDGDERESFRFVLLPTFDCPTCIRLERNGVSVSLIVKALSGQGGFDLGTLKRFEEHPLPETDWEELQRLLSTARYWDLPPEGENEGLDGSGWFLEGVAAGRAKLIHRWSPESDGPDQDFKRACAYLLDLANREKAED